MTPAQATTPLKRDELDLSLVATQLMKGVVYHDTHPDAWRQLLQMPAQVRDYVAVIGLTVTIDESEGYAYLRSAPDEDETSKTPRLVARRSLSFHVSLLLALLRKKLAESDAADGDTKLVLPREQIVEMVRVFMPEHNNEARLTDQIDAQINKAVELGFLRRIKGPEAAFEVRRILKAFVDGQWLSDFNDRLAQYAQALPRTEDDA